MIWLLVYIIGYVTSYVVLFSFFMEDADSGDNVDTFFAALLSFVACLMWPIGVIPAFITYLVMRRRGALEVPND